MSVQTSVASETVPATISQYFNALRSLDREGWMDTFAEDAISYEPIAPEPLQGKAAIRGFVETVTQLFKSLEATIDFVQTVNQEVAVKWTIQGVGHNDQTVKAEGIDVFELNPSGKIQTLHGYWDPTSLAAVQVH